MLVKVFEYPFMIRILNKILNDDDKIKIISLNKFFNNKRTKFTYDKQIIIIDNKNEWYCDCLTNIVVYENFKLPKHIIRLTFGNIFNECVDFCLPNSVNYLTFGNFFNKPIENCIPNSVVYLTFGCCFDQPVESCIPNSVTYLRFSEIFKRKLKTLPSSLRYLRCSRQFYEINKHIINDNVKVDLI